MTNENRLQEDELRVIRLPEVMELSGKSKTSIYEDPEFPKPIKIGRRSSGWIKAEVLHWLRSKIEARGEVK